MWQATTSCILEHQTEKFRFSNEHNMEPLTSFEQENHLNRSQRNQPGRYIENGMKRLEAGYLESEREVSPYRRKKSVETVNLRSQAVSVTTQHNHGPRSRREYFLPVPAFCKYLTVEGHQCEVIKLRHGKITCENTG